MKRPAGNKGSGPRKKPAAGTRVQQARAEPLADLPEPHAAALQQPLESGARSPAARLLVYASDCSGLDGGAMALKSLGLKYEHLWASEKQSAYRKIFEATHPDCAVVFHDMTSRPTEALEMARKRQNQLLLYCAGWPCQPYSGAGLQQGEADARSKPVWAVLLAIEIARPDLVLLENVPPFIESGKFRKIAKECIDFLMSIGNGAYYVDWQVLDAYTHGGAPWKHQAS